MSCVCGLEKKPLSYRGDTAFLSRILVCFANAGRCRSRGLSTADSVVPPFGCEESHDWHASEPIKFSESRSFPADVAR